jgi:hypothetical protein
MYDVDERMIYHLILAETEVTKDRGSFSLTQNIHIYIMLKNPMY